DTTSNAPLATTARHVPATTARTAAWATTRTGDRMVPMMTPPAPGTNHPNRTFRRTALADHAVASRLAAWSGYDDMLGTGRAGVMLLLRSTTRRGHHPVPPHSRTQGETHACSSCHLRRRRRTQYRPAALHRGDERLGGCGPARTPRSGPHPGPRRPPRRRRARPRPTPVPDGAGSDRR